MLKTVPVYFVGNPNEGSLDVQVLNTLCTTSHAQGAVGYYETSAVTGAGVNETIEFCVGTVLKLNTRY